MKTIPARYKVKSVAEHQLTNQSLPTKRALGVLLVKEPWHVFLQVELKGKTINKKKDVFTFEHYL